MALTFGPLLPQKQNNGTRKWQEAKTDIHHHNTRYDFIIIYSISLFPSVKMVGIEVIIKLAHPGKDVLLTPNTFLNSRTSQQHH